MKEETVSLSVARVLAQMVSLGAVATAPAGVPAIKLRDDAVFL